jgi:hypothetical protein
MKIEFPKIVFKNNLTNKQKNILSIILTILVLTVIFGTILFFTNTTFQNFFYPDRTETQNNTEIDTTSLNNLLPSINPDSILYEEITYEQLDIYPKAWIEKYFNSTERSNLAFSGPSGDADGDNLSNKLEYIYGSNPRKKYTFCTETDVANCQGLNDKQKVDNNISPLTGARLEKNRRFRISKQDNSILNSLEDSIETATREGVDFPTLYQLSLDIDLTSELNAITIRELPDNRDERVKYTQFQIDIIKQTSSSSDVEDLGSIFVTSDLRDLEELKRIYSDSKAKYESQGVPRSLSKQHQVYILVYSKIIELIDLRIEGIKTTTTETVEYQDKVKKKAVEAVWGYRIIGELNNQTN